MSDQAEQLTEKAGDEIPSKKSKARTETKSSDKKGSTKSVPGHSREPKDQNVSTALARQAAAAIGPEGRQTRLNAHSHGGAGTRS